MAHPTHLEKLLEGVKAWNAWRQKKYPRIAPNLEGVTIDTGAVEDPLLEKEPGTGKKSANL